MFERFIDTAIKAVMLSQEEARRTGHNLVGTEQLLLGLMAQKTGIAAKILQQQGVTLQDARRVVEESLGRGSGYIPANIPFTPKVQKIFEQAVAESRQLGHNYIGTEHLLLAIARDEETAAVQVLKQLEVDLDRLRNETIRALGEIAATSTPVGTAEPRQPMFGGMPKQQTKLADFSTNLTQLAKEGKIDPVVGREREIDRAIQILCRRTKNNPVLVGEPGVGKTAIAAGLAQRIIDGDVPSLMEDKQVVSLDMGLLVAGTRFRGDFEERIKAVVDEVKTAGNIILVIDEIHTLIGAGGINGAMDAANLLKPALARGELQCFGATTLNEYRQHIEKDAALERRFQKIVVGEPSVAETIEILHGLRESYETFHKVQFSDAALEAAAKLSERYISDRFLPDKAIDLIDEAGSREHLRHSAQQKQNSSTEDLTADPWESATETLSPPCVDTDDIAQIVAAWTGIPVNKLTEAESEILLHLEANLHERLIGQNEAVTAVSRAVRRARVGMKDPNRPIASFIFCGPTGVGKTELSKALAAYLFGDAEAMIRLDMSEFMESHTVSKLVGSPPGYIGYDEGGQLTEAVRRNPYRVVLFDEIEKAHPDVFNLLLQLLDDGRLTDSQGRVVDFKNTLIIMTSNLGSKAIEKGGAGLGFALADDATEAQYHRIRDRVGDELKNYFRPEFLNRLDDVIVFRPLLREEVEEIAELMLQEVRDRLQEIRNIYLAVSDSFKAKVVEAGYDPAYGARPLRRAIMSLLEDSLAEAILSGAIAEGNSAWVDVDENGQVQVLPTQQPALALQAVG
ncbi:ATP-dependent Clp protease ATP-binding subunit [Lusitaniella coriacea]|uniref:ATP-dependent Clp protease ATP-binding subunit n=1 Tax=Lusitaniella coriacea TaxID=1983105 RepID=UPI003CE68E38